MYAFKDLGTTVSITNPSNAGSDRVALNLPSDITKHQGVVARVVNDTDSSLRISFGNASVTADSTCKKMLAGTSETFTVDPQTATYMAAVTESGTSTGKIDVTIGLGE